MSTQTATKKPASKTDAEGMTGGAFAARKGDLPG
jgi:hypothetical protein